MHESNKELLQACTIVPLVKKALPPQIFSFVVPLLDDDLHEAFEVWRLSIVDLIVLLHHVVMLKPAEIFDASYYTEHLFEVKIL